MCNAFYNLGLRLALWFIGLCAVPLPTEPRGKRQGILIGILAIGAIGTMLAATIVNVAPPSIIGAFGLSQDQAQWLSTAFLTSSTSFMLLNTWTVANFGMRRDCFVLIAWAFAKLMMAIPLIPKGRIARKTSKNGLASGRIGRISRIF